MLLAETGELSTRRGTALNEHLAGCPSCRKYQVTIRRLTDTTQLQQTDAEPSAAVMTRILAEARAQHPGPHRMLFWRPALVRSLGLAASMMLVVGAWFYYSRPAADDTVGEFHALLSILSEENAPGPVATGGHAADEALKHLGARLIELEGLEADDGSSENLTDEEIKALQEPDSTVPPESSTDAFSEEMRG
jgi:hypothetical protein